jgi:hypothetical protein
MNGGTPLTRTCPGDSGAAAELDGHRVVTLLQFTPARLVDGLIFKEPAQAGSFRQK